MVTIRSLDTSFELSTVTTIMKKNPQLFREESEKNNIAVIG